MNMLLRTILRIDGAEEAANRLVVRLGMGIALLAIAVRFFFWAYTGRLWEDALITTLHSENLFSGLGLTHYRVGQAPLHGFTSPLSVLVPMIGDALRIGWGLHVIRFVGACCGGLTVLYALGFAIHPRVKLPAPLAVLLMGYLACEHSQILWGMAGMETQMVVLVLLMSAYYAMAWKPVPLGISLALCMYARPDFAFWTIIVGLYVLVKDWRQFPKVAGIALALYAPWLVAMTLYYGHPIPNTVFAKSGYTTWWKVPDMTLRDILVTVWSRVNGSYAGNTLTQPLGPTFPGHGTGFHAILNDRGIVAKIMTLAAVGGFLRILWGRKWFFLPIPLFLLAYGAYYLFFVPVVFGWYVVPYVAVVILLSVEGLSGVGRLIPWPRIRNAALALFTLVYLGILVGVLPITFYGEHRIQRDIEMSVRRQVGLFLNQVMANDDTLGCECLGYFGYYSRRTVYDWPGLANREVVAYSRTHPNGHNLNDMLRYFKPDFLALRERNGVLIEVHGDWVLKDYEILAHFYQPWAVIEDIPLIEQNIDTSFMVLRRRDYAERHPGTGAGIVPAQGAAGTPANSY